MKKINIIQINDVHGYIKEHDEYFFTEKGTTYKKAGGYARIKTVIDTARSEAPTLVLDGGDTFHGTKPVVQSKGEVLIPILNHLGLDGMTGHWDFAYGPLHLKSLMAQLNYPFLACNVYDEQSKDLVFKSHMIKEVGDVKVLVIGIAATIVDKTMPAHFSEGIYLSDGQFEVQKLVDQHKAYVDLVVVNSHMGYPQDVYLARQTQGVDIWLSAHTHNRLESPTIIGDTILIQSGSHGSFVGKLSLTLEAGRVTYDHKLLVLDQTIKQDASMLKIIAGLDLLEDDTVIGETQLNLHRNDVLNSPLDYLLLKAISRATQLPLVFSNGWRYGPTILKGELTYDDLYNMIPMNPTIMVATLSGKEIKAMLEDNIEKTFASDPMAQMGGFLKRVFGLKIYFKIENPNGLRIQSIMDQDGPLIDSKMYEVAYLTEQGVPQQYGMQHHDSGIQALKALEDYLSNTPYEDYEPSWITI